MRRTCAAPLLLLCLVLASSHAEAVPLCPHPLDMQAPIPFEGTLQVGCRYSAAVTFDPGVSEWRTVVRPRPALHQGVRLEWMNLEEFPRLGRHEGGEFVVVFDIVSREAWSYPDQRTSRVVWSCRIVHLLDAPRGDGPAQR